MRPSPPAESEGPTRPVPVVQSLVELIRRRSLECGAAIVFITPDRTWSYAQLDEESNRIAQGLLALGIERGDCVACLTKHAAECALLLLGANKIGAVLAPLNWRLSSGELAYVTGVAAPKLIIADEFLSDVLDQVAMPSVRARLIADVPSGDDSFRTWAAEHSATDSDFEPACEDVSVRLFSSGTTGNPKAADVTHSGILVHCEAWAKPFGYRRGATTHLNVLPTFHVSGIVNAFWMVYLGGIAVFLPEFNPERYLQAIEKYHVTDAFAVPAMLRVLLDCAAMRTTDLSSLRCIAYGGSPVDEELIARCLEMFRCGFLQVYGMTEASGTITALLPADHDPGGPRSHLLRSVGPPGAHFDMRVVRPIDGETCVEGEVGEVWIRSPQMMRGYFNDEAANAAAFPHGRGAQGGWFRTGDAGFVREGYLYLQDRIKDMIISGGENVYPAEVEAILSLHPAVAEVAVIGVPDERWGETVKACVVLRSGHAVTAADLIAYARARLAHYKCPTSVDLVAALPRNPSGKLLKRVLRGPYWAGRKRDIA